MRLRILQSAMTKRARRSATCTLLKKEMTLSKRLPSEPQTEIENVRQCRELTNAKFDLKVGKSRGGIFREGVEVKRVWIEKLRDQFSVTRICPPLAVSRSGCCQRRTRSPNPRRAIAKAVVYANIAGTIVSWRSMTISFHLLNGRRPIIHLSSRSRNIESARLAPSRWGVAQETTPPYLETE